ncbi:MAG: FGGY family carbohydrate kinase [Caldilinea sp.]
MAGDALLVGIDIGTTNIKAVIFDIHGRMVAAGSSKTPVHYPRPGWAFFRPEEIWEATVAALRTAIAQVDDPQRIVSLAVASIGESGVPISADGHALYDAVAWFDTRTEPQARWLAQHIGSERIRSVTGLTPQPIFGLCKLLWLQEHAPEVLEQAAIWLHMADFIAFRLSGVGATDYSLASRTLALNLSERRWERSLIEEVGLPFGIFPRLARGGDLLGCILPDGAEATGLPPHTAIGVGGHDHLCGAMAVGACRPGILFDSIGTAEGLLITIDKPLTDPTLASHGYEMGAHVAGGYYAMGAYRTAGACIDWFRSLYPGEIDYAALIDEAAAAPPGSQGVIFLPHLRLPHSPSNDPKSRGGFVGVSTDATRGCLFRAILEGLAYETRSVIEPLLERSGMAHPERILAIGGATRNRLLMEMKAAVFGQPITVVQVEEATSLGAALLGGVAAGVYDTISAGVASMRFEELEIKPDHQLTEFYGRGFDAVYRHLYGWLRPLNHATFDFLHPQNIR